MNSKWWWNRRFTGDLWSCKQSCRTEVFEKVKKATEIFQKEYGGINCKEILHGECPKAFQCRMKVKDAVLIISQILEEKGEF